MNQACEACGQNHPHPGERWFCWLAANDRRYQRAWGLPVTAPEVRPPVPDWVRRGEPAAPRRPGLGDAVAGVAKALGFKECGGCAKRRAWLNRLRWPWS